MHTRVERDRKRARGWFTEGGCGAWWRNTTDDEAAPPRPAMREEGGRGGRSGQNTKRMKTETNATEKRRGGAPAQRDGEGRDGRGRVPATSAPGQRTRVTSDHTKQPTDRTDCTSTNHDHKRQTHRQRFYKKRVLPVDVTVPTVLNGFVTAVREVALMAVDG